MDVSVRDDVLFCTVKDTGCGIPKADQDKIFGKLVTAHRRLIDLRSQGVGERKFLIPDP